MGVRIGPTVVSEIGIKTDTRGGDETEDGE